MEQVTLLEQNDSHWYTSPKLKGKYLPSVSTILGTLKDGLEFVSAWDLKKAQERGIKLHKATEDLEHGITLDRNFYDDKEWLMLLGFARWYNEVNPRPLLIEGAFASKKLGYGGTIDRIYLIDGLITVLDLKTTSVIYDKHFMQVAAYAEGAIKSGIVKHVHQTAILRLSDKTKIGYQYERRSWGPHGSDPSGFNDFKAFQNLFRTYSYLNPDKQPTVLDLPETISLEIQDIEMV